MTTTTTTPPPSRPPLGRFAPNHRQVPVDPLHHPAEDLARHLRACQTGHNRVVGTLFVIQDILTMVAMRPVTTMSLLGSLAVLGMALGL